MSPSFEAPTSSQEELPHNVRPENLDKIADEIDPEKARGKKLIADVLKLESKRTTLRQEIDDLRPKTGVEGENLRIYNSQIQKAKLELGRLDDEIKKTTNEIADAKRDYEASRKERFMGLFGKDKGDDEKFRKMHSAEDRLKKAESLKKLETDNVADAEGKIEKMYEKVRPFDDLLKQKEGELGDVKADIDKMTGEIDKLGLKDAYREAKA